MLKMGLFDAVKGVVNNAQEAAKGRFHSQIQALLIPNEEIEDTIGVLLDSFIFTNKRVIFIDNKILSSKRAIVSIPYSKITEVILQSTDNFNYGHELTIQVGSVSHEVKATGQEAAINLYKKLVFKVC